MNNPDLFCSSVCSPFGTPSYPDASAAAGPAIPAAAAGAAVETAADAASAAGTATAAEGTAAAACIPRHTAMRACAALAALFAAGLSGRSGSAAAAVAELGRASLAGVWSALRMSGSLSAAEYRTLLHESSGALAAASAARMRLISAVHAMEEAHYRYVRGSRDEGAQQQHVTEQAARIRSLCRQAQERCRSLMEARCSSMDARRCRSWSHALTRATAVLAACPQPEVASEAEALCHARPSFKYRSRAWRQMELDAGELLRRAREVIERDRAALQEEQGRKDGGGDASPAPEGGEGGAARDSRDPAAPAA